MKKTTLSLFVCLSAALFAQSGKNGALTVSSSTVLNSYSPVTANIAAGSSSLAVLSPSVLLHGLCTGDLIMIYQAQGAAISNTNAAQYGSVTAFNSAGLYEFAYVKDLSGNTIDLTGPVTNSYSSAGMTQVVKVPQYTSLTVNASGTVVPRMWTDSVVASVRYRFGGIVALHASTIVNNGLISSVGAGFRGGQLDVVNTSSYNNFSVAYTSTVNAQGGEKGESIAGYQPEYDLIGGRYARGAPANGGGGGCGLNAAGGGGSNGNNGNTWTGQGNMIVDASNPLAAWALDPDYISNGNSLTTSSGGGRGGYSVGAGSDQNALAVGPGNSAWAADDRREAGGLGGHPMTNISAANRIYFGGGGGAGDENDGASGPGGNGGGIVYLVSVSGVSGTGSVKADGANGSNTINTGKDAPSGGGGGGSIVIVSPSIAAALTVQANGGLGGNQYITTLEAEGPGGGGGGGFVAFSSTGPVPSINGGMNGSTNSPILTEFPFNGGTMGAAGQTGPIANSFITFNSSSIVSLSSNAPFCPGSTLSFSATSVAGASYSWQGPGGFTSASQNPNIPSATASVSGTYSLTLTPAGCPGIVSTISVSAAPSPTLTVNNPSICAGQTATLIAGGATTYSWSTGVNQATITVNPFVTTSFTVNASNGSCVATAIATVIIVDCTLVPELSALNEKLNVYPNPASGIFTVSLDTDDLFDVSIHNSIGQLIDMKKGLAKNASFETDELSKGLYCITISCKGASVSRRLIVH